MAEIIWMLLPLLFAIASESSSGSTVKNRLCSCTCTAPAVGEDVRYNSRCIGACGFVGVRGAHEPAAEVRQGGWLFEEGILARGSGLSEKEYDPP